MVSFAKLAELSNGNVGFVGGTAQDSMPEMGLSECANALSMYLCESIVEDFTREETRDDQLFEAAMQAIECRDVTIYESAVAAINEADEGEEAPADSGSDSKSSGGKSSGVWARIKHVFQKIADFFRSLVTKAGAWIATLTKDGPAFYNKYASDFKASSKTHEFKGGIYKFDNDYDVSSADVFGIMGDLVSGIKKPDQVSVDEAKSMVQSLKVDKTKVVEAVKASLGVDKDKEYFDYLRGEEQKNYTASSASDKFVKDALVDTASPKAIKAAYNYMLTAAQDELHTADAAARAADRASEGKGHEIAAYANAYAVLFKMVTNELNSAISAELKAVKASQAQAKRIMRAVISGKDSGAEADAVEGETPESAKANEDVAIDIPDFDFDL